MTLSSTTKKMQLFSPLGSVGCLPTSNIFHLANEFAKGKMFWNQEIITKYKTRNDNKTV